MSISQGISLESKEKMKEVYARKQEEAKHLRQNIRKYAEAIQQEIETLTPFWLNSYIDKMQREHVALVHIEAQMELLSIYSETEEQ